MGYSEYSANRTTQDSVRTQAFMKMKPDQIFEQNKVRQIHEMMNPKGVKLRESRDSDIHPNSIPIILALDVTGSMGHIPVELIRTGLPHIMNSIIAAGLPDPQILFLAIGDHKTDRAPLQVSQFESGDADLDTWLTRVWLESMGGGNRGESYPLTHWFANHCVETDAWDKRKQKGFIFTIGDERFHETVDASSLQHIMGSPELKGIDSKKEIQDAAHKWNTYHLFPGVESDNSFAQWQDVLGERAIFLNSHTEIAETIKRIVVAESLKTPLDLKNLEEIGNTDIPEDPKFL
jgi:hypothetical protein